MSRLFQNDKLLALLTWVLTGLLAICFVGFEHACKSTFVVQDSDAQQVEVDCEDDLNEFGGTLPVPIDGTGTSETWQKAVVFHPAHFSQTRPGSHRVRGPPRC
jgi:hypothetical protein